MRPCQAETQKSAYNSVRLGEVNILLTCGGERGRTGAHFISLLMLPGRAGHFLVTAQTDKIIDKQNRK